MGLDIITIHVDDIRGSSPTKETGDQLLKEIGTLFDIRVNKPTDAFLGIQTEFVKGGIKLKQTGYAKRLLMRFGMEDCKPVGVPMTKDVMTKEDCPKDVEEKLVMKNKVTLYRSILGSLNYLSAWTRPDLTYAVSVLSRFAENPGLIHLRAAKRVLRYVKGSLEQGITYLKEGKGGKYWGESLEAYVDADYATNPDNRKSMTGIYVVIGGGAIYWFSKQQPVVALSTAEAEYIAACQATKEVLWARKLVRDLKYETKTPTLIWEDNQACIRLTENPESFART